MLLLVWEASSDPIRNLSRIYSGYVLLHGAWLAIILLIGVLFVGVWEILILKGLVQ